MKKPLNSILDVKVKVAEMAQRVPIGGLPVLDNIGRGIEFPPVWKGYCRHCQGVGRCEYCGSKQ
jgi:hypothetical protein